MAFKSVSESFVFLSVCSLGKKKTDKEERPKENKEVHKHKSIIINICTIYGRGHMLYGVTLMWHFIFPYHGVQHCWRTVSWQEIIALQKGTVFLISNSGLNGLMAGSVAWRITQIIIENSPVKTEVSWTTYSGLSWHIFTENLTCTVNTKWCRGFSEEVRQPSLNRDGTKWGGFSPCTAPIATTSVVNEWWNDDSLCKASKE